MLTTYLPGADIDGAALARYIGEQIYAVPGITRPREAFTILLTGSRALGWHTPASDVDIDVLCPQAIYNEVHAAALAAGLINGQRGFYCALEGAACHRYFGLEAGCPHFSLTPLERVAQQFHDYDDVPLWIWTHARVIADPNEQFTQLRDTFHGYPRDVLVRKLKYRWLSALYAGIDTFPQHPRSDADLLPAALGLSTAVAELLRVCCLADGKPFPYPERLPQVAYATALGQACGPLLQHVTGLITGHTATDTLAWQRLQQAHTRLFCPDLSHDAALLAQAVHAALRAAGVDPAWVQADYDNIDELLWGELGPAP
jgi:hypothetical protein